MFAKVLHSDLAPDGEGEFDLTPPTSAKIWLLAEDLTLIDYAEVVASWPSLHCVGVYV